MLQQGLKPEQGADPLHFNHSLYILLFLHSSPSTSTAIGSGELSAVKALPARSVAKAQPPSFWLQFGMFFFKFYVFVCLFFSIAILLVNYN